MDEQILRMWREALRARFGDALDADLLEAAVAECVTLHAIWGPMAALRPDNGEMPFPNLLPKAGEKEEP